MDTQPNERPFCWFKNHVEILTSLLLFLLWLPQSTWPQKNSSVSGTVVVADWQEDEITIATDSRGFDHLTGTYNDNDCKIAALNDHFLIASAGVRHFDSTVGNLQVTWDNLGLAKRAFSISKTKSVVETATIWWRLGTETLDKIPPHERNAFIRESGFTNSLVFFAGVDKDGRIQAKVPIIDFKNGSFVHRFLPIKQGVNATGDGEPTVAEFMNQTTERAKREAFLWKLQNAGKSPAELRRSFDIELVKLAIQYDGGTVGGVPEVVELRSNGTIQWYERGPCNVQ